MRAKPKQSRTMQKVKVRTINGIKEFDVIKCHRCGDVLKYTLQTTGEKNIIYTKKL